MATKREAQASQSAYFGAESSVGSEVRQVVTHRSSFAFLLCWGFGQKRLLRYVATSPGVRWSLGVSKVSGAEGAWNGGSCHGWTSGMESKRKSG